MTAPASLKEPSKSLQDMHKEGPKQRSKEEAWGEPMETNVLTAFKKENREKKHTEGAV
jgi:hypothetical protein